MKGCGKNIIKTIGFGALHVRCGQFLFPLVLRRVFCKECEKLNELKGKKKQ